MALLTSLVQFPGRASAAAALERSDVKLTVRNLGRFGKVGVFVEHDLDPSRRWHLPRVRPRFRTRNGGADLLMGWWDWAVTLKWTPATRA